MCLRVKKAIWLKRKEDFEFKYEVEKEAIQLLGSCKENIYSEHDLAGFFMSENPFIPEKNFPLVKPHFKMLDY